MEHLALEVFDRDGNGSKYAFLPDDTSITITETSEIFDSGDIWSHAFTLNIPANAHIFGTAGEMHGSRLHEQIDKRRARLWVEGLPLYYGYLRLDDEVEVDANGDIDISFESGQKTFKDMIDGVKANQVPMPDDVLIGMALDRERTLKNRVELKFKSFLIPVSSDGNVEYKREYRIRGPQNFCQMFPKFVRPDGTWYDMETGTPFSIQEGSLINTDYAYEKSHPYCNIMLSYRRQEFESSDSGFEKKPLRRHQSKKPRSINPAPNFYVLYWIDALMKHLNINPVENQMLDIEDLRRLFFVNTKCAYEVKDNTTYSDHQNYQNLGVAETYLPLGMAKPLIPSITEEDDPTIKLDEIEHASDNVPDDLSVSVTKVNLDDPPDWQNIHATWHKAYATSENFPDVDIEDVVNAIENGFGVRFLFNDNYTKVRIVLLRNVLRSQEVHKVSCEIYEESKQENSIRGFRITYGGNEDDTNYFYRGFSDKFSLKEELWPDTSDSHDYSQWNTTLAYAEIKGKVGMLNKTCYIDKNTGNSYIVKIDENWKKATDEAYPSLFNCADFMDAEDGDCTGEEETINEVRVGFTPMIVNSITREDAGVKNDGYTLFVDEEMGVSKDDITIDSTSVEIQRMVSDGINMVLSTNGGIIGTVSVADIPDYHKGLFQIATSTKFEAWLTPEGENDNRLAIPLDGGEYCYVKVHGAIRDGYILYLQDNYDPTDDLTIPIEEHKWGLTLGIMRSSGSDAYIDYKPDLVEDEDNETWEIASGSGAYAHCDTCDDDGNIWDYDGSTGYNAVCATPADAIEAMIAIWGPKAHNFSITTLSPSTFLTGFVVSSVEDNTGVPHTILLAAATKDRGAIMPGELLQNYVANLRGKSIERMLELDRENLGLIIETDSSREKGQTLLALQKLAYDNGEPVTVSGGVDVREGRLSLKLRAEKPNPFYDPNSDDPEKRNKYLEISNPNLRQRGIIDRLYKEYSYWIRNAKIAKMKVRIGLAELLGIDKTVRQSICDITGFIKKMQYRIDMQSGLVEVEMEVWYL